MAYLLTLAVLRRYLRRHFFVVHFLFVVVILVVAEFHLELLVGVVIFQIDNFLFFLLLLHQVQLLWRRIQGINT